MNNLNDRFLQLNADIEELRILVDESESKLMMFNDVFEMVGDVDSKKLITLGKKNIEMYLDFIHNHIAIIRKISPNIANDLEGRAIRFERIAPRFMELPKEKEEYIKHQKEEITYSDDLSKLLNEEIERLNKGIQNKEKQKELETLEKESKIRKISLEEKFQKLNKEHKSIESELTISMLTLHDNVMMASKTIIDTLDFLTGEKVG